MSNSPLRVAMIGSAFMGRAHSQAWQTAPRFFDLARHPELALVVGRDPGRTAEVADRFGWAEHSVDWRSAIERPDIDVIDICTPGDTHAAIAIAALEAGKHVLCEKPLANSVEEAGRMTLAAERAAQDGVVAMCGFSYRRTPALALARRFVEQGRIGKIRHIRAQYLQDWLADPEAPFTWRMDVRSPVQERSATLPHTASTPRSGSAARPSPASALRCARSPTLARCPPSKSGSVARSPPAAERREVTVDDAVAFTASLSGGGLGVFEATRAVARATERESNRTERRPRFGRLRLRADE